MTPEELEAKLNGGAETQSFEVKGACDWRVESMAKDILAMTNVQDGGYIVIGVEDGTFARQGISAVQRATYDVDIMRDQMASYADPHVRFTVSFPNDASGLEYAVIRVLPFDEVPVISPRNRGDILGGVLYYRNNNGRVQSAPISNSYDLRDVITTATVRMMQRLVAKGLGLPGQMPDGTQQTQRALEEEREGL